MLRQAQSRLTGKGAYVLRAPSQSARVAFNCVARENIFDLSVCNVKSRSNTIGTGQRWRSVELAAPEAMNNEEFEEVSLLLSFVSASTGLPKHRATANDSRAQVESEYWSWRPAMVQLCLARFAQIAFGQNGGHFSFSASRRLGSPMSTI